MSLNATITDIEAIVREAAALDAEIKAKTDRLKGLKAEIAEAAEFKPGSKTGKLAAAGFTVKVQLRENEKWDQEKLAMVEEHFPTRFRDFFKSEFKPVGKKQIEAALMIDDEFSRAVGWAREVTPGAPQVSFESLQEGA